MIPRGVRSFIATSKPGGFIVDRGGGDGAAQDMPEVLERQGGRPGEQGGEVQAGGADTGEEQPAQDGGAAGESGDMCGEVAAALNACGQINGMPVYGHDGFPFGVTGWMAEKGAPGLRLGPRPGRAGWVSGLGPARGVCGGRAVLWRSRLWGCGR